jgi:hypothetical protein
VNGERIVNAEFPTDASARTVLRAIGADQRTYTTIQRDSGLAKSTFDRSLAKLLAKQVVEKVTPVSVPLRKDAHYVVADAHLRFWTRRGDDEIDLVGVDSLERARKVGFVGSIKWRKRSPFDRTDAAALAAARATVPGAGPDALQIGISRSGFDTTGLDVQLGPIDIVDAFR